MDLELFWSGDTANVGVPGDVGYGQDVYGHSDDGNNDVSRGESRKVMRLHKKMNCILQELRIWFDPAILTICTVPYNMMFDQHAMEMNEKVGNINGEIRQIQQRSVLPVRFLDVGDLMEQSLPRDASSDGITSTRPRERNG